MFDLRYYQSEAVDAVHREWESVQSTAIIAVTGSGKTEVYSSIAVRDAARTLVLVHRDYLIRQPVARLAAHGFTDVAVEKAKEKSEVGYRRAKIVFASVQSIGPKGQEDRLLSFDPYDFGIVIVDEAHRGLGATYRRVLEHFSQNPKLKILLLTATPKRKDGVALGNICDSVAYTYPPSRAIEEGWTVPVQFFRRDVKSLDFSGVKLKGADLDQDQIERLMAEEGPLHEVCASLCDFTGPTIVFVPGVNVGHLYAELINRRYRPGKARMIHGDTPDEEREEVGKMLAAGEVDYLVNCGIVTEGYDVPILKRVVWAAPTASIVRYTQGTGRVFRPHPSIKDQLTGGLDEAERRRAVIEASPKPFGEVVTYYPQNCKHQLCDPIDILGGDDLPKDVAAVARQVQDETSKLPSGSATDEDIETARVFADFKSILDKRLADLKAKADYEDSQFDPMSGLANNAGKKKERTAENPLVIAESWGDYEKATPGQVKWLLWKKVPQSQIDLFTKWRASVVRDLFEMGCDLNTALGYKKRQALAVRESMKAKLQEAKT